MSGIPLGHADSALDTFPGETADDDDDRPPDKHDVSSFDRSVSVLWVIT